MSIFLLSPLGDQQRGAATGIGAMLLLANVVVALTTGSYFDAPAEANPLLHTWSLSVEEQFYLLFPTIMLSAWWISRRKPRLRWAPLAAVALVSVISLGLVLSVPPEASVRFLDAVTRFYSPVTRAWEFAFGALAALLLVNRKSPLGRIPANVLATIGLVGVAGSFWLVTDSTIVPGPTTLFPVVGTVLILVAGTQPKSWVNRTLATPALTWIGDRSYSIYLWHWPLIVFAVAVWPRVTWIAAAAAAVSLLPALLSFRWVEQPLRVRNVPSSARRLLLVITAVAVPIAMSVITLLVANNILRPSFQNNEVLPGDIGRIVRITAMRDMSHPCNIGRLPDLYQDDIGIDRCMQSKPGDTPIDVALLGDSHAEHLYLGLAKALPGANVMYEYLHNWQFRASDTGSSLESFDPHRVAQLAMGRNGGPGFPPRIPAHPQPG
jgi:peptidoglycan/LPS O-acetylase OafA/YrhL